MYINHSEHQKSNSLTQQVSSGRSHKSSFAPFTYPYLRDCRAVYRLGEPCCENNLFSENSRSVSNCLKTQQGCTSIRPWNSPKPKEKQMLGLPLSRIEGKAIRILGSWQGNGIRIQDKWNNILEKQMRTIKRWAPLYPSVAGRVLLTKSLGCLEHIT